MIMQILSKVADTKERVGQPRATQKGWLTPYQTASASGLILLMGFTLGIFIYLQYCNSQLYRRRRRRRSSFNNVCYDHDICCHIKYI